MEPEIHKLRFVRESDFTGLTTTQAKVKLWVTEEVVGTIKDLDMLGNLDPSDPPLHFNEGSNDLGVHSHVFPKAIKAKADRIGVPCTVTNDKDSLQSFMLKHLGVSGGKAGEGKSGAGEK